MDYFEGKEIDSHALVLRMEQALYECEDAFLDLPKPLQQWFATEYPIGAYRADLALFRLIRATEAFATLIGADEEGLAA